MQSWKPQLFTGADVLQPPRWLQVSLLQLSSQLQEDLRHVRLSLHRAGGDCWLEIALTSRNYFVDRGSVGGGGAEHAIAIAIVLH